MTRILKAAGAIALLAAGLVAAGVASGGYGLHTITQTTGHTPVTICHKPGTPAEQTLVVDDDSVELTGHLGHGDTIGPCPTDTTPTDTTPTDTTPTDTTPTDTTPTTPTPPGDRCPPGMTPTAGKDGQPGNDECEFPTTTTTTTASQPPVPPAATPPVTTTPTAPPMTAKPKPPVVTPKPKPAPHKTDKPVKLTGNPKTDKCHDLHNGTMRCKGVIVTPGQG